MALGFFLMLRFHSYSKLCWENLTIVLKGGEEVTPSKNNRKIIVQLLVSNGVAGSYFTFDDKFHPGQQHTSVRWAIYTSV